MAAGSPVNATELPLDLVNPPVSARNSSCSCDFVNLAMSALVALSLLVSTVATVAAEIEPLEPNCLLQKAKGAKEQQLAQQPLDPRLEAPDGFERFCGPCRCFFPLPENYNVTINQCKQCPGAGFLFRILPDGVTNDCRCCSIFEQPKVEDRAHRVDVPYYFYVPKPVPPPNYVRIAGPYYHCESFVGDVTRDLSIEGCRDLCENRAGFVFVHHYWAPPVTYQTTPSSGCRCCADLDPEFEPTSQWSLYGPAPASIIGDPHITTLDGQRYTLLSQGTFSLWHFSGVETELHSEEIAGTKNFTIDWQVYVHYAGRQSFTKGLLLIDKTGGSMRQVLEITSQDCKWKARKGHDEWTVVDPVDASELISVPDGEDYVTGFDLSRTVTGPHAHRFPNRVRFKMNTKDGKSDIAVLSLSCRPNHNMNAQIAMNHKSDQQFVDGELQIARTSLSTLQKSADSEFSVDSKWQDLGGSEQAAWYLQRVDEPRASLGSLQTHGCGDAEKAWAKETCSKHLGDADGPEEADLFEDCIYDLCHGAGETQAELAAELLATTKAN